MEGGDILQMIMDKKVFFGNFIIDGVVATVFKFDYKGPLFNPKRIQSFYFWFQN